MNEKEYLMFGFVFYIAGWIILHFIVGYTIEETLGITFCFGGLFLLSAYISSRFAKAQNEAKESREKF
jgi:hypothetical protein